MKNTYACVRSSIAALMLVTALFHENSQGADAIVPAAPAGQGRLVVTTSAGPTAEYMRLGIIEPFQQETGIKVTFNTNYNLAKSKAAIDAGLAPPEDVITSGQPNAIVQGNLGYLAKVDYSLWDAATLKQVASNDRQVFSIGWSHVVDGICFDKRKFPDGGPQPKTWSDFWNVTAFPGARGMYAWDQRPGVEFALLADGVPVGSLNALDVDRAFRKMDQIRKYVPKFAQNDAEAIQQLVDGRVVMSICYPEQMQRFIDGGLNYIGISLDQGRVQSNALMVWRNAPNIGNAMKFLAYVDRADVQARWVQIAGGGVANPAALDLIPASVRERLPVNPKNTGLFERNLDWNLQAGADGKTNLQNLLARWAKWYAP